MPAVLVAGLRPEHRKPGPQVPLFPAPQQVSPDPPQVEQTSPDAAITQEPAVHGVAPPQQVCPSAPQGAQVPAFPCVAFRPEQAKPALQLPLTPAPQQACPDPPQLAEQTLPPVSNTQEPTAHGVRPPQQACPSPPHGPHVPGVPCAAFRPEHARPVLQVPVFPAPQQVSPDPPQVDEHTLPPAASMHDNPVLHALAPPPGPPKPGQQVCACPTASLASAARAESAIAGGREAAKPALAVVARTAGRAGSAAVFTSAATSEAGSVATEARVAGVV